MTLTFVETRAFSAEREGYFGTDEEFRAFQNSLLRNPTEGSVIKGCGGIRKIRWRDPRRGKGARGGLRIIYLYVAEAENILLLDVYDKDETADLTAEERRTLSKLADQYRVELQFRPASQKERLTS